MPTQARHPQHILRPWAQPLRCGFAAVWLAACGVVWAQEKTTPVATNKTPAAAAPVSAKEIGRQVREALGTGVTRGKQVTVTVNPPAKVAAPTKSAPPATGRPGTSRQYIRERALELANEVAPPALGSSMHRADWSYLGDAGPAAWGRLRPEYAICTNGRRQSPIDIDESTTLRGPAVPIGFDYHRSNATVVHNGRTIEVDVGGDNGIFVRGSRFQLLQLHFHLPAEEKINGRGFTMGVHLLHRNHLGQTAVVAVLLEPGVANPAIDAIWTYMPLEIGDRVVMPAGTLDMNALLPRDPRYYQYLGSLTIPPCTEDVLWLVLKQPIGISAAQLRLFGQLFANNARPIQPTNGRLVRDAQ